MILIRKTVRIVKVCVLAAKKLGAPVHEFCEFLYRTGNLLGNGNGHFVGRLKHDSHQCLISCEFLAGSCVNAGVTGRYAGGSTFGNCDVIL